MNNSTRTKYFWNVWHPGTTIEDLLKIWERSERWKCTTCDLFSSKQCLVCSTDMSHKHTLKYCKSDLSKNIDQINMSPRCNEKILSIRYIKMDIWGKVLPKFIAKTLSKIHLSQCVPTSKSCAISWSAQITRQNILKNITASKVIKEGGLLDPWSKAGLIGKIYKFMNTL